MNAPAPKTYQEIIEESVKRHEPTECSLELIEKCDNNDDLKNIYEGIKSRRNVASHNFMLQPVSDKDDEYLMEWFYLGHALETITLKLN